MYNYKDIIAAGECVYCRMPRGKDGTTQNCRPCANKYRDAARKRYKRKREEQICYECSSSELVSSGYCIKHWVARAARNRLGSSKNADQLLQKLKDQNFECVYTGRKLVLGVNASVDHIVPVSSAPELATSIDNVVWCDLAANKAKSALSIDEFKALCRDVAKHLKIQL